MRLSRPVAAVLLVVVALVVLGLALSQGWAGDQYSTPTPTVSGQPAEPAPPSDEPEPPSDEAAPTGTDTREWDDIDACRDDVLPPELEEVADDVEAGGPFEFPDKDGSTFGNYEGYLPDESRGYYREYTVETPGLDHRGARRIVTGGGSGDRPEVWYFTDDHYESFCEFAP